MNPLLLVAGIALVAWAVVETIWTTLWTDGGAGPLTNILITFLWRVTRVVLPHERHVALSLSAPIIVLCMVATWIAMLWGGWTLIFGAQQGAIVNATTRVPADFWDTTYFAAFNIFTLGLGDFVPTTAGWQLATGLAAGSGLIFITIAVTFLISVLNAVANKRSLAMRVSGMGGTPERVLVHGWEGDGFHALAHELQNLSSQLNVLVEQHMSHPVLHFFHSRDASRASVPALAVLDDTLSLLAFGVAPDLRPPPVVLLAARSSVSSYLGTVGSAMAEPSDEVPPCPQLRLLREAGIATVPDGEYLAHMEAEPMLARRRLMAGLVQADEWEWDTLASQTAGYDDVMTAPAREY